MNITENIIEKKIVKIDKCNKLSIIKYDNNIYEIAHMKNGTINYNIIDDVVRCKNEDELQNEIEYITTMIVEHELQKFYNVQTVEQSLLIDGTLHEINIVITYNDTCFDESLTFHCSTILYRDKQLHEYNDFYDFDKNCKKRKTLNGVINYIEKYY